MQTLKSRIAFTVYKAVSPWGLNLCPTRREDSEQDLHLFYHYSFKTLVVNLWHLSLSKSLTIY